MITFKHLKHLNTWHIEAVAVAAASLKAAIFSNKTSWEKIISPSAAGRCLLLASFVFLRFAVFLWNTFYISFLKRDVSSSSNGFFNGFYPGFIFVSMSIWGLYNKYGPVVAWLCIRSSQTVGKPLLPVLPAFSLQRPLFSVERLPGRPTSFHSKKSWKANEQKQPGLSAWGGFWRFLSTFQKAPQAETPGTNKSASFENLPNCFRSPIFPLRVIIDQKWPRDSKIRVKKKKNRRWPSPKTATAL